MRGILCMYTSGAVRAVDALDGGVARPPQLHPVMAAGHACHSL